jgi:fructose-1,6-bisphosphatase-3
MQKLENQDLAYLHLLARQYPSIRAASSAIINLSANLELPKGTEHFLSDIHGEYEAFSHVLRSGSGALKRKIDELFSTELEAQDRQDFATLIYYPEQKLPLLLKTIPDQRAWFQDTLFRLIRLCRNVSSKYTRAAVQEALPADFALIINELLHEQEEVENRLAYYQQIINTIIDTGSAGAFIVAISKLIQRLAVARLHILGDVYDRGPGPHKIMDALMDYHELDFQWGNHDILWMGAAAGSEACMANVIRIALRYASMETLVNGYAISLLPLVSFAMDAYQDDACLPFIPKSSGEEEFTENEILLMARMHKAIAVIQLKLEAQVIQRNPHFQMQDRLLLEQIDFERGQVCVEGKDYPLIDSNFPTINPAQPYRLTSQEEMVVEKLKFSFAQSERLQKHARFLLSKGSMYRIHNGNLLYHGCIPMNPDGSFTALSDDGQQYTTQSLMEWFDRLVRQGFLASQAEQRRKGQDAMWYLWSGQHSPLFGKRKMATFERYFIADKSTHKEKMNPYYDYRDRVETAKRILREFDLDPGNAHIINGHVPVKVKAGENPVKASGHLLVIDGGFSKAYQEKTGIAGYTLIFNSYGLLLASHQPFESTQKAIEEARDMRSRTEILETNTTRILVKDTDTGREMQQRIDELKALLQAYRTGLIQEM